MHRRTVRGIGNVRVQMATRDQRKRRPVKKDGKKRNEGEESEREKEIGGRA